MQIETGWFSEPSKHHKGWFRVFRFKGTWTTTTEIWFGHRYLVISR